jgi:hypothetical protein
LLRPSVTAEWAARGGVSAECNGRLGRARQLLRPSVTAEWAARGGVSAECNGRLGRARQLLRPSVTAEWAARGGVSAERDGYLGRAERLCQRSATTFAAAFGWQRRRPAMHPAPPNGARGAQQIKTNPKTCGAPAISGVLCYLTARGAPAISGCCAISRHLEHPLSAGAVLSHGTWSTRYQRVLFC